MALGDSFTEGLDDLQPDGRFRGWADRVATQLALHRPEPSEFRYANLAIRGRRMPQIAAEQVPVAADMRPDLVSLVGGVNDLLRPSFDLQHIRDLLTSSVDALKSAGAQVLLLVGANPAARSPRMVGLVRGRLDGLNDAIAEIAEDQDCLAVNLTDEDVFADPRMWSPDRLHLSGLGHERIAGAYLETLGLGDDSWREPLPEASGQGVLERVVVDAKWAGQHLAPWIGRRLAGRSSGDGLTPKRPDLEPLLLDSTPPV